MDRSRPRCDPREQGVVVHVTIYNARHLNALNSAVMEAFTTAMAELAADGSIRAVVLTGAGTKAFIAGADIDEMAGIAGVEQAKTFITRLHLCCDAIRNFPVPVIARIQGYCFGGGLEVAAACDVRIASDASSFGMQEVKLGILSVIEAALLPTLVGWGGRARSAACRSSSLPFDRARCPVRHARSIPMRALRRGERFAQ